MTKKIWHIERDKFSSALYRFMSLRTPCGDCGAKQWAPCTVIKGRNKGARVTEYHNSRRKTRVGREVDALIKSQPCAVCGATLDQVNYPHSCAEIGEEEVEELTPAQRVADAAEALAEAVSAMLEAEG